MVNNRIDQVKSFFAQPERYLKHNFNIRIRAEVVAGFVGDTVFESILDIGCGNGAIYLPLRNALHRNPYPLNRLSGAKVMEMFSNHGLELSAIYRYNLPLPGMARVFTDDSLYERTRRVYGTHTHNDRSWLGSECIYHF